jgi:hypothetical protein
MFPEETLHCVEWARDLFGQLFSQAPKSALKILEEGEKADPTSSQDIMAFREGLGLLRERPKTFEDCVEHARKAFEHYFNHAVRQLLHVYPLDAKTKEGAAFWSLPKRPPTPLVFDAENMLHLRFIASMACLRATVFRVKIPSDAPRTDEFRKLVGKMAAAVKVADFVPDEAAAKEIQDSVDKNAVKNKEGQQEEPKDDIQEEVDQDAGEIDTLKSEFFELLKSIERPPAGKTLEDTVIKPEEFEKDDDSNYHIDFMSSMGNCRAASYGLELMDWLQVKLKAGRIVPAMATTTASIAGL